MEHLVRHTLVGQFCGVTSGQEGELSVGKLRSHNVEQLKALPSVRLERSLERLPRFENPVAHERVIPETGQHGIRCSLFRKKSRHLGICVLYGLHLFQCLWHIFIWLSDEKYRGLADRLRAWLVGLDECGEGWGV